MFRIKPLIRLTFTALAVMVFFWACQDDPDETDVAERDGVSPSDSVTMRDGYTNGHTNGAATSATIDVRITDSAIELPASISDGQKTFRITNADDSERSFKIEGQGVTEELDAKLAPGETKTLSVVLQPGSYTVSDPSAGAANAGASKSLMVTSASGDMRTPSESTTPDQPRSGTDSPVTPPRDGMDTTRDSQSGTAQRSSRDSQSGTGVAERSTASQDKSTTPKKSSTRRTGGSATVEVKFSDNMIEVPASIKAGQKTLKITNNGTSEQDFQIIGAGVDEMIEGVKPGESKTIKLNLQAGTYEIHRMMEKELTVTEASDGISSTSSDNSMRDDVSRFSTTDNNQDTSKVSAVNGHSAANGHSAIEIRITGTGIELPSTPMRATTSLKITNASNDTQQFRIEGDNVNQDLGSLKPGESRTVQVNLKAAAFIS
jgi:iron uptake system EfeUOB component EfeO/EfeM